MSAYLGMCFMFRGISSVDCGDKCGFGSLIGCIGKRWLRRIAPHNDTE